MSGSIGRIHACVIAGAIAIAGFAGTASAESYARFTYDSSSLKPDGGGPTTKGKGGALDFRGDLIDLPLFWTFGVGGGRSRAEDTPFDATARFWDYGVGLGYFLQPSSTSEWYVRLAYAHDRAEDTTANGKLCCYDSDSGRLGIGGYKWFNSVIKGYAEAGYTKAAHDVKGYDVGAGLEFAVTKSFRVFAGYDYGKSDAGGFKFKEGTVEAGIKFPFMTPVARAAAQAAAPDVAPAPPAPKGTVGQVAKLKAGAQLRGQPKASANPAPAAPDGSVTLQNEVANAEGTWWYVQSGDHFGWVRDTDLDLGAAK